MLSILKARKKRFNLNLFPSFINFIIPIIYLFIVQLMEILFETHSSPATFIAPSAMLSAFCSGRPTSLVIDFGASETRITPVVDGHVLRKATLITQRGGDWIDQAISKRLELLGITAKPWFDKSHNMPTVTPSFRTAHTMDIMKDIKKWMCFVPKAPPLTAELLDSMQMPPYELPDGTMVQSSLEICTLPEQFFFSSREKSRSLGAFNPQQPAHMQTADIEVDSDSLQDLVHVAISRCDADTRKDLLSNITICGGGSCFDGLIPRITSEISYIVPHNLKVKALPLLQVERQFSSWIGGSILGICGSFQQLWVSKQEYEEYGGNLLAKQRFIH